MQCSEETDEWMSYIIDLCADEANANRTECATSSSKPAASANKRIRSSTKPKRCITGYIVYAGKHRKDVQRLNPHLGFGEISRLVGKMWGELPKSEKEKFEMQARKLLDEQVEQYKLRAEKPGTTPLPENLMTITGMHSRQIPVTIENAGFPKSTNAGNRDVNNFLNVGRPQMNYNVNNNATASTTATSSGMAQSLGGVMMQGGMGSGLVPGNMQNSQLSANNMSLALALLAAAQQSAQTTTSDAVAMGQPHGADTAGQTNVVPDVAAGVSNLTNIIMQRWTAMQHPQLVKFQELTNAVLLSFAGLPPTHKPYALEIVQSVVHTMLSLFENERNATANNVVSTEGSGNVLGYVNGLTSSDDRPSTSNAAYGYNVEHSHSEYRDAMQIVIEPDELPTDGVQRWMAFGERQNAAPSVNEIVEQAIVDRIISNVASNAGPPPQSTRKILSTSRKRPAVLGTVKLPSASGMQPNRSAIMNLLLNGRSGSSGTQSSAASFGSGVSANNAIVLNDDDEQAECGEIIVGNCSSYGSVKRLRLGLVRIDDLIECHYGVDVADAERALLRHAARCHCALIT